jgi:hypothetical protein
VKSDSTLAPGRSRLVAAKLVCRAGAVCSYATSTRELAHEDGVHDSEAALVLRDADIGRRGRQRFVS